MKQEMKQIRGFNDFPEPSKVTSLSMMNYEGQPAVIFITEKETYFTLLTTGFLIHCCNEFLRGFDFGFDIFFNSYSQYCNMLNACGIEIEKRQEKGETIA